MSKKKVVTKKVVAEDETPCPRAPSPDEVRLVMNRFMARIDDHYDGGNTRTFDWDQSICHALSWALTGSAEGHAATWEHDSKVLPPSREMIKGAMEFSLVRGQATNFEGVHSRWSSTAGAFEWFLHGKAIGENLEAELSRMGLLDKFRHRGRDGRAINTCPCGDWSDYEPTCSLCRGLGLPDGSPHDIDKNCFDTWCPECRTTRRRLFDGKVSSHAR